MIRSKFIYFFVFLFSIFFLSLSNVKAINYYDLGSTVTVDGTTVSIGSFINGKRGSNLPFELYIDYRTFSDSSIVNSQYFVIYLTVCGNVGNIFANSGTNFVWLGATGNHCTQDGYTLEEALVRINAKLQPWIVTTNGNFSYANLIGTISTTVVYPNYFGYMQFQSINIYEAGSLELQEFEAQLKMNGLLGDISNKQDQTNQKLDDINKNQQQTNDKLDDLNNNLTNSDVDNPSSSFDNFKGMLPQNGVITDLVTMPITLFRSVLNSINGSCSTFSLGNLLGTELKLPCINISQYIGSTLWGVIDILFSGFFVFTIGKKFIDTFNKMSSMEEGDILD